jgi:hypothetical protein
MKITTFLSTAGIIVLIGFGIFYFRDNTGPSVKLSRDRGAISARTELGLDLQDAGTGLKQLTVQAIQGGKTIELLAKQYPKGSHQAHESIKLAPQGGLQEGPFKLRISARDRAPRDFGRGNNTEMSLDFSFQNRPPRVAILSTAHNVSRGGAGLVVYTCNVDPEKNGVVIGDRFYPGFRQSGDVYACLFPFPYDMPAQTFVPKVLVVDRAGNDKATGIYYHTIAKTFPNDRIGLNDAYLQKVSDEFKKNYPDAKTPLQVFLMANRQLRDHDVKSLLDTAKKTSPLPLWEGGFLRQPNAAPRGSFAQLRSYVYQGKEVDRQTHLGIDLASLAHVAVQAANNGKVVYADDLGIYGQCVIVDHGLGLQTLYGHLSRIGVKVGDEVKKGQSIGNSGDTGMAGGDHLHFGVVVGGEQVNPIEWWDTTWLKNNITGKFELVHQAARPAQHS